MCGNSANNKEVTGGSKVVRWTIRFSFPRFHSIGFFLFHFSTYSALELVLGSDAFRVAFFSLFLYPAFTSLSFWIFYQRGCILFRTTPSRAIVLFPPAFIVITYISFLSIPHPIHPILSMFIVHHCYPFPPSFSYYRFLFPFPTTLSCHHISSRSLVIPYIPRPPSTPSRCHAITPATLHPLCGFSHPALWPHSGSS